MTPPVFAHGHLRLYLLSLLAERPMHGYELIQALSDRFGGTYAPSAGTIYPRLARLEEEGLVTKQADGRRTVYAATEAGRREVEFRRSELDGIEADVSDSVRRLADDVRASVDDAMRTLRADLAAAARDARPEPTGARADDPRVRSRMQLQRAEAALTEFRAQVRADLRREVVGGELPAEAVELLLSRLDDVRRDLAAALRR
jgi:DNA-binding PadR family transcriptional regulator